MREYFRMRAEARSASRHLGLLILPVYLAMTGCAVGPDFKQPSAPDVSGYTKQPLTTTVSSQDVAGGEAQQFVKGGNLPGDWWTLFHSPALDALIKESLNNNPDLKAAKAALAAAREDVEAQTSVNYPNISAGFSASRQRMPTVLAPVPNYPLVPQEYQYNLFTPQVSVSYDADVFGLNKRTVESLQAQAQGVRFQMIATYITLTSNVVNTAIEEGVLQNQIDATHRLIDINSKMLGILKYQLEKGYASKLDLAAQQSQLAQVRASLPPLLKQSSQLHHQLAVLTGHFPNQSSTQSFKLTDLQLPKEIPVSLPSKLVEQRPDVRQAQANLHAASAEIGVAEANRFPSFSLTATTGSSALLFSNMFKLGTGFWGVGAALTAPLFDGGSLSHQESAAKDAYKQAAEQYRSTVLTAFQNVADTLTALQQDAEGLKDAATAAKAAKVTLDLSQRQWKDGYTGYISLLNAEQNYQQAEINLAQAQGNRYADTAALFQALGGGWWNRADLTKGNHEN